MQKPYYYSMLIEKDLKSFLCLVYNLIIIFIQIAKKINRKIKLSFFKKKIFFKKPNLRKNFVYNNRTVFSLFILFFLESLSLD